MRILGFAAQLSARCYLTPAGALLGAFFLVTPPFWALLSPQPSVAAPAPGHDLTRLALVAGGLLAVSSLGRREALLELTAPGSRIAIQGVCVGLAGFAAASLSWVGRVGEVAATDVLVTALASLHLVGLALPLLAVRTSGLTRVGLLLALTWIVPALASGLPGWPARIARLGSPPLDLAGVGPGAFLLPAAIGLAGVLGARSLHGIR